MIDAQNIINKLNTKVFSRTDLTASISVNTPTQVRDEYGDLTDGADNIVSTTGVILNYVNARAKYDRMGMYDNASHMLIIPIEVTVTMDSIITSLSDKYNVIYNPIIPLGSVKVFQKVFVQKQ